MKTWGDHEGMGCMNTHVSTYVCQNSVRYTWEACERECIVGESVKLACFLLSPTPTHPVLSCPELSTMKDLGAAQYRTPQGGQDQSWLPRLSGTAACRSSLHSLAHPSLALCPDAHLSHTSTALSHEDPSHFQRRYYLCLGSADLVPSQTSSEQTCSQNSKRIKAMAG